MALLFLLVSVLALFARFTFLSLQDAEGEIQTRLHQLIDQPVSIGKIETAWEGWLPVLHVADVVLLDKQQQHLLGFDRVTVRFSIIESLIHTTPRVKQLSMHGAELSLIEGEDGRIRLASGNADKPGSSQAMQQWFLQQNHLQLADTTIILSRPHLTAEPLILEKVDLNLRNAGQRHQLDGSAMMAGGEDTQLHFVIDIHGDLSSEDWHGELFIDVKNLALQDLPQQFLSFKDLSINSTTVSGKFWSRWHGQQVRHLTGSLTLEDIDARYQQKTIPVTQFNGYLTLEDLGDKWYLMADESNLEDSSGIITSGSLEAIIPGETLVPSLVAGELKIVSLDFISALTAKYIPQAINKSNINWLNQARPVGDLINLSFVYQHSKELSERLSLRTDLQNVSFKAARALPGANALSGRLAVTGSTGNLRLHSENLEISMPRFFSHEIYLGDVIADVNWKQEGNKRVLIIPELEISSPDIGLVTEARLDFTDEDALPHVTMSGLLSRGNMQSVSHFIPDRVLHPSATDWLNKAFVSGAVDQATILLDGDLKNFPFDDGKGSFEISARASNTVLHYESGWPDIEIDKANVVFDRRTLTISSDNGGVFGAQMKNVVANIHDLSLDEPVLTVTGDIIGSAEDGLRFLRESPLKKSFGRNLEGTSISGDLEIDLELEVPLSDRPNAVNGRLLFDNNQVVAKSLALDLEGVSGQLIFTEQSMQADKLQASLFGNKVDVSLRNTATSGGSIVRLDVAGNIDAEVLAGYLVSDDGNNAPANDLLKVLSGSTAWQATLDIRQHENLEQQSDPVLLIQSDLIGMSLALPAPLGKKAEEAVELTISTLLTEEVQRSIRIEYASRLSGSLIMNMNDDDISLQRGTLYIGSAIGPPSEAPGLSIIGALDEFSLSDWLVATPQATIEQAAEEPGPSLVSAVNLSADRFELMGQWLENTVLRAHQGENGGWDIRMESDAIQGSVTIPSDEEAGSPVIMQLDRIKLQPTELNNVQDDPDPGALPPLVFTCADLSIGDINLGRAELTTKQTAEGMHVQSLKLENDQFALSASGDWTYENDQHISQFTIDMSSPDVSQLIQSMGYDRLAMEGGEAEFSIDASWRGSPMQFSLAGLNGTAHFSTLDGHLLDVDPGAAGRFFGLISLQALPRRLTLDFSDLFKKGLSYDRVEGSFTIDNGDAYTNNLTMFSPSARIDIGGRVGLVSEDYDQLVTVTPDVSTTLPLAGAVAGGPVGAAIGAAATLIMETVFKEKVREVVNYQYQVTGSWDKPEIKTIENKEKDDDGSTKQ